jgi:hypothetical protein
MAGLLACNTLVVLLVSFETMNIEMTGLLKIAYSCGTAHDLHMIPF